MIIIKLKNEKIYKEILFGDNKWQVLEKKEEANRLEKYAFVNT